MRYIKIKDLQPGMILAQPLLNKKGDVFLARNVSISRFMVQRIREEQYRGAYVYDKLSKGINPKNQISADVQLKTMCALKDMDIDRCSYLSGEILASLKHVDNISMNINSLAAYDSSTYMHSLNVAMYAGTFGLLYGMEYERVSKLIAAALLHDIGKTKIPEDILNKPGRLSEEEFAEIKKHPQYGYDMLKDMVSISPLVRVPILEHHENYDGSGYPKGLTDKDTHIFSKIIHICDVYDAMLSRRCYKDAINPGEVIDFITANRNIMFNGELVDFFIQSLIPYPEGILVKLSDGRTAVVASQNKGFPQSPVVRDMRGNVVDLIHENNVKIVHIEV